MGIRLSVYIGGSLIRNYFCGWYFRCQSNQQTLAIIPSVHKTKDNSFCTIQLLTDEQAFHASFPLFDFQKSRHQIGIGKNQFTKDGIQRMCSIIVQNCCKVPVQNRELTIIIRKIAGYC